MARTMDVTVKPEIYLLEDLLRELISGKLRVPRFQRAYVWRPEQMLDLFDSIERNYPIGSVLVWDSDEPLASLDHVGGLRIPEARGPISYLLDGHQRLSTLLGVLQRPSDSPRTARQDDWMWWVYRELGVADERSNRFGHWRQDRNPPPHYFPLRAALRTMDFLAYARELQSRAGKQTDVEALIAEAEELTQRIKSYKVAVVRLIGGNLSQAVEVFSRLNSKGQAMTPDQMVSALTYRGGQGPSLGQRIEMIQEDLASGGFGEVPPTAIFRTILSCAGEDDVLDARWEALAQRVQLQLADAVEVAELALSKTIEFLRLGVGVPLARLVPYNLQIVLLATFFATQENPTSAQLQHLRKWFWATSWSGYFAGANSTQVKDNILEMKNFALEGSSLKGARERARPFPERFDMRSARVRIFVTWELSRFPIRMTEDGDEIEASMALASADTRAYRHVVPSGPLASSPANRLVFPTRPGVSVRKALIGAPRALERELCYSHGIPEEALARLREGDDVGFVELRSEFLAGEEREFIREMGVEPSDQWQGEADIDTD
jgi:Protein of unknown function DUF262